jgi:putative endonuclease
MAVTAIFLAYWSFHSLIEFTALFSAHQYTPLVYNYNVHKSPNKISHYTYILRCCDQTLYVGSTNDIKKRLHSHNNLKSGAHYTKIRRPVELVWSKKYKTLGEARKKEAELKRLSRAEKLLLLEV